MAIGQKPQLAKDRFNLMLTPDYPLCREEVVWMLEYIKKKVADEASALSDLPQPRLLQIFQGFADTAMILIKQRGGCGPEADRIRSSLRDAGRGLLPGSDYSS